MKILIVDDSKTTRDLLKQCFKTVGHEIVGEASNGIKGLELYKKLKPDMVILDVIMPGMKGIACLSEIRKFDDQAKVIMCSAMLTPSMKQKTIDLGAIDFIDKPFRIQEVLEKLNKYKT